MVRRVAVLLAGMLLAWAAPARAQVDLPALNAALIDGHVAPGYARFATAADGLDDAVGALCAAPTEAGLAAARAAFRGAVAAWSGVQHLRLGPVEADNRYHRIDHWPDRKNAVGRHLARAVDQADQAPVDPDRFRQGSVAVQGLPALERLLYGPDHVAALMAGTGPGRCRVATAITANLAALGGQLAAEWAGPARRPFLHPGPGEALYRTPKEVTGDLVGAFGAGVEMIRDLKLGRVLAADGATRPQRGEWRRAGLGLLALRDSLKAQADLFHAGLDTALETLDDDGALGEAIQSELAAALRLTEDLGDDLTAVLADPDGQRRLALLSSQLSGLKELAAGDLRGALGLGIGFNAFDGD